MACWSAWPNAPGSGVLSVHQKEASPQLAPPSSERKRSMPPAHTRFGSTGSTATTLSYQPWLKNVENPKQPATAYTGFVSSSVLRNTGLVLVTMGVHVTPWSVDLYTARRPRL